MKFWDDEKSITLTRCVVVAALIGSIAMTLGGPWVTAWFIAVAGLRPSTGLTATLLVLGYACAALAIGMLVSLYKFLRRIEKGEVFVPENVAALRRISWCCAGAAVLCLAAVFICYRPFVVLAGWVLSFGLDRLAAAAFPYSTFLYYYWPLLLLLFYLALAWAGAAWERRRPPQA